jgi:hypothetical protein
MAARVMQAGALDVELTPGKRGRYELMIWDFTGWDPRRDVKIQSGDEIPEKPWISCNLTHLRSLGRGRETLEFRSFPVLVISHHAISRTAQRLGLRTRSTDALGRLRAVCERETGQGVARGSA